MEIISNKIPLYTWIRVLEVLRCKILKHNLRYEFVRRIYCNRASRLAAIAMLAILVHLPLSLLFPLGVLVLGPFLWGYPHLVMVARYVPRSVEPGVKNQLQLMRGIPILLLGVAIVRALNEYVLRLPLQYWPELGALVVMSFLLSGKSRSLAIVGLLALFLWAWPIPTVAVLLFLHNIIAFLYWSLSCKSDGEKRTAHLTLLNMLFLCSMIYSGVFDTAYYFDIGEMLHIDGFTLSQLIRKLFPWCADPIVGWRLAVIYAFSQSLHYFVWLRAIPDQHHDRQTPSSFIRTVRRLQFDFGRFGFAMILYLTIALMSLWLIIGVQQARLLYFAWAGAHGFIEIVALLNWITKTTCLRVK